ncbi:MAG: hypothetical protein SangKO_064440 [Sandaracinaceae bacterium]
MTRALLLVPLLLACGGPPPPAAPASAPEMAFQQVQPPGSRLRLTLPASMRRVRHTLRYEDAALGVAVQVSDATVTPGNEAEIVEADLARLRAADPEVRARPITWGSGIEGVEVDGRMGHARLRILTLWRDGALARVLVRHPARERRVVARILDSVQLDPSAELDPVAVLGIRMSVPAELSTLLVSNEELVLRTAARAVPFPSGDASIDVVYAPFVGARPESSEARGRLLGARFSGLPIEGTPQATQLSGSALPGYQIAMSATVEGTPLLLYGAYLETEGGAFLLRASVDASQAERWAPRFEAMARSLRPRAPVHNPAHVTRR